MEEIAESVGGPATTFADPQELSTASSLAISDYGDQNGDISGSGPQARRTSDTSIIASSPEDAQFMKIPQLPVIGPYARVSLENLCDIPLFEVPARPWTHITDSDFLVSHLVSVYFTWDHPGSQFLDQRIFLAHMKDADLKSEFCTPLLVNSLLAMASVCDSRSPLHIPFINYHRHIPIALMFYQTPTMPTQGDSSSLRRHNDCGRRNSKLTCPPLACLTYRLFC